MWTQIDSGAASAASSCRCTRAAGSSRVGSPDRRTPRQARRPPAELQLDPARPAGGADRARRHLGRPALGGVLALAAVFLAGAVLSAVHHAEVVASHVGEPFGSLILALAVTVIEVGLIVTLMVSGDRERLAGPRHGVRRRDDHLQRRPRHLPAVGSAAPGHAEFNAEGIGDGARDGAHPGDAQPRAADLHQLRERARVLPGAARLRRGRLARALRAFVFVQTARHRDFFLPHRGGADGDEDEHHARRPAGGAGQPRAPARGAGRRRRLREGRVAGRSRTSSTRSTRRSRRSA